LLPFGGKAPVLKEKRVVGGGYRLNSICPVCGSSDRERLIYLYLLHESNTFRRRCTVLHVAPEEQLQKILSCSSNVDYLTADLLSQHVMVRMDITRIPLPDNSFDVILCNHVLEFVADDHKAMAELCRVLKPGGWAILQVPISLGLERTVEDLSITTPQGREEAFGDKDALRIYACDYETRLARAGFHVEVFSWLAKPERFGGCKNKHCLIREERVHVARKS
jgi:SAM-dependent methyltransferase